MLSKFNLNGAELRGSLQHTYRIETRPSQLRLGLRPCAGSYVCGMCQPGTSVGTCVQSACRCQRGYLGRDSLHGFHAASRAHAQYPPRHRAYKRLRVAAPRL